MGRGDNESFASTINRASELPDDTGTGANLDLPQLLSYPIPPGEHVETDVKDSRQIQGVPKYRYNAKLARFIIGTISMGFGPEAVTETYDESQEYEKLMNEVLAGRAVIRWEERQVLKDGTVIIVISWLEKRDT